MKCMEIQNFIDMLNNIVIALILFFNSTIFKWQLVDCTADSTLSLHQNLSSQSTPITFLKAELSSQGGERNKHTEHLINTPASLLFNEALTPNPEEEDPITKQDTIIYEPLGVPQNSPPQQNPLLQHYPSFHPYESWDRQAQWERDELNYADPEVHYFFPQGNYPRQLENISSEEGRLLEHLFFNYNPLARPVLDSSNTVNVDLRFSLLQIQDLNIRNQILTSTGFLILEWKDERLAWEKDVSMLDELVVRGSHIWRPEFAVINGADSIYEEYNEFKALVKSDGTIRWEPGGIFKTICTIDVTFYPFDTQRCEIKFGAWSYHTTKMNLSTSDSSIRQDSYEKNGEWEVTGTDATRHEFAFECCQDQRFSFIAFAVYLRRRHTFYVMNVIVPGLLTSAVLLSLFYCVPSQKVHIGVAALLSFRLFLVNVADTVPRTSDHIPLLGIYLTCTMAITTMAMVATVVVGNLYERKDRPVPKWLKKILLEHVAKVLCMRKVHVPDYDPFGTPVKKKRKRSKSAIGEILQCRWLKKCCKNNKKSLAEEETIQQYSSSEQLDETEDLEMIATYDPRNRRIRSRALNSEQPQKARSKSFDVTAALISIRIKQREQTEKENNEKSTTNNEKKFGENHQERPRRRLRAVAVNEASTSTASATPTSERVCIAPKKNYSQEWAYLASVCDRVFFWLCLFFILATTLLLFHPLTTSRFFKIPVIDKR